MSDAAILGFDDGPFPPFAKARPGYKTVIVGTLMKGLEPLWFAVRPVTVDGLDSTSAIIDIAKKSPAEPDYLMLSGITFAGFNVADPDYIYEALGIPLVIVVDRKPDLRSVERALRKHFPDWRSRLRPIASHPPLNRVHLRVAEKPVYFSVVGASVQEAAEAVRRMAIHGKMPEPLRISGLLASQLASLLPRTSA